MSELLRVGSHATHGSDGNCVASRSEITKCCEVECSTSSERDHCYIPFSLSLSSGGKRKDAKRHHKAVKICSKMLLKNIEQTSPALMPLLYLPIVSK